mmetsp:Transcript_20450/g.69313  ORF Transcript_20450/g.69313 Transcript_20450/m.69313 type:complete len:239 (+) Transcript_20450:64-780(+)
MERRWHKKSSLLGGAGARARRAARLGVAVPGAPGAVDVGRPWRLLRLGAVEVSPLGADDALCAVGEPFVAVRLLAPLPRVAVLAAGGADLRQLYGLVAAVARAVALAQAPAAEAVRAPLHDVPRLRAERARVALRVLLRRPAAKVTVRLGRPLALAAGRLRGVVRRAVGADLAAHEGHAVQRRGGGDGEGFCLEDDDGVARGLAAPRAVAAHQRQRDGIDAAESLAELAHRFLVGREG